MNNPQKEVQTKLTKGLLDLIVLQFLETESMHGYKIITAIRKSFGVYLGPSTIYPLLGTLEEKGYVKSKWNMDNERPRKVYELTNDGKTVLAFTANSLTMICRDMKTEVKSEFEAQIAYSGNDHTPKRTNNLRAIVK
jgi:DNA-binding PadR family transcriptional regulator